MPYLCISVVSVYSLEHYIDMTNIRKAGFGFSLGISSAAKGLRYTAYSLLERSEHLLPSKVFQLLKSEKDCNSFKISTASFSNSESKGYDVTNHQ